MIEVNVSPFATNVLDLVDDGTLRCPNGDKIDVRRSGSLFIIYVEGAEICRTADNLSASYCLNRLPTCRTTEGNAMTPQQLLALCDAFLSADTTEQLDACEDAWDEAIKQASPEVIRAAHCLATEEQPCNAN